MHSLSPTFIFQAMILFCFIVEEFESTKLPKDISKCHQLQFGYKIGFLALIVVAQSKL